MTDELAEHAMLDVTHQGARAMQVHQRLIQAQQDSRAQWGRLFGATCIARSLGATWEQLLFGSQIAEVLTMWRTLGTDLEVRTGQSHTPLPELLRAARTREDIATLMHEHAVLTPIVTSVGCSATQAAQRLGVPRSTVIGWLESGVLQCDDQSRRSPRVIGIP